MSGMLKPPGFEPIHLERIQTMQSVEKLASTKKIKLTDEEKEFIGDKKNLLDDSFTALTQINTDGIQPLIPVLEAENILRDDIATKAISRDELLKNAPEQQNGYFQVPKTVE